MTLIEHVWGFNYDGGSNVGCYVRDLRSKVDPPFQKRSIETVRGAAYLTIVHRMD